MSDSVTSNPVTIYTTTMCAFCATEKQWLDKLGVSYVTKNIEEDEAANKELLNKLGDSFQGVPVTDINGEIIRGFDRPKLQAALEKNSLVTATA